MASSIHELKDPALELLADYDIGSALREYYRNPPERCDLCGRNMASARYLFDFNTRRGGWANACGPCFNECDGHVAWGSGQMYVHQPDGEWLQVAGFSPYQLGIEDDEGSPLVGGYSTRIGFVNRNKQRNDGPLGIDGTDHGQQLYKMTCASCHMVYAANGSDIHLRRCPSCDNGKPSSGAWKP